VALLQRWRYCRVAMLLRDVAVAMALVLRGAAATMALVLHGATIAKAVLQQWYCWSDGAGATRRSYSDGAAAEISFYLFIFYSRASRVKMRATKRKRSEI